MSTGVSRKNVIDALGYMVANIGQPVCLETKDGFENATRVLLEAQMQENVFQALRDAPIKIRHPEVDYSVRWFHFWNSGSGFIGGAILGFVLTAPAWIRWVYLWPL